MSIQYTIRRIPEALDKKTREEAKQIGKSVNRVVLETLQGPKLPAGPPYQDLDWLFDSGGIDKGFDDAIRSLDSLPRDLPE